MKRILTIIIMLFLLVVCMNISAYAAVAPLPMDFSGGIVPQESGYLSDTEYEDPSIHVQIETGVYEGANWWAARIKIADASQIRTVSAGGFDTNMVTSGPVMAKRVNAVVAVDGDFYCYNSRGYVVRQGIFYRNNLVTDDHDIMLIDDLGDMHIAFAQDTDQSSDDLEGRTVVNAFTFGPALIVNGEKTTDFALTGGKYGSDPNSKRCCIAQVGKLEYVCLCAEGMTLANFTDLIYSFDVQTAYNLDGGNSSMLYFHDVKLNDPTNSADRQISDIIYFASAYTSQ